MSQVEVLIGAVGVECLLVGSLLDAEFAGAESLRTIKVCDWQLATLATRGLC